MKKNTIDSSNIGEALFALPRACQAAESVSDEPGHFNKLSNILNTSSTGIGPFANAVTQNVPSPVINICR
jgi:hypothetical protein